ncbi:MAG: peptidoglycan-binding protein [Oscillospiraceae bacterium]|jgi:peptidoglycan hydrolase-like protein with peptidoglycan-binding domain|nr:peptidoglycan-binding protein [Oscillospiraceae bacterium]
MATPVIPPYITVHLGNPKTAAKDVRLPFKDYIKNVASSEIYPTWNEQALRANIYAIVSFALNRIYTEHYRAQGYPFDITSSTAYDQAFVEGRDIFANISTLVDETFNDYITWEGQVQPMFAMYCNGTTVKCKGMSQWGSQDLAKQGYSAERILKYYYGDNITFHNNAPEGIVRASYPGRFLRRGSIGEEVRDLQRMLRRVSGSFPAIPKAEVNTGIFDQDTDKAVREFQRVFGLTVDGIVGQETWYRLVSIYNSVKRLGEYDSEGINASEAADMYRPTARRGDSGFETKTIQYYLNFIADFVPGIGKLDADGVFGSRTEAAVKAFQKKYGLVEDGIVGRTTWNYMQGVYNEFYDSLPAAERGSFYPGYALSPGDNGPAVVRLQTWLNDLSKKMNGLLPVTIDGDYGSSTAKAVSAFQEAAQVPQSGEVGPLTWNAILEKYDHYFGIRDLAESYDPAELEDTDEDEEYIDYMPAAS